MYALEFNQIGCLLTSLETCGLVCFEVIEIMFGRSVDQQGDFQHGDFGMPSVQYGQNWVGLLYRQVAI